MRHITVEGTSFNPTLGGVVGVKSLDRSLEVGALFGHGIPSMWYKLHCIKALYTNSLLATVRIEQIVCPVHGTC